MTKQFGWHPVCYELKKTAANFLDVGAGVAKISLRLCQTYENVKIVALEPADMPYSLAKKNINESKYAKRIELRKMYLQDLPDKNVFDVVWFPHIFFPDDVLNPCLDRIWEALKPGAKLITTVIPNETNQSACVRKLINALYGGLRSIEELTKVLTLVGFRDIKIFSVRYGYQTITAIK